MVLISGGLGFLGAVVPFGALITMELLVDAAIGQGDYQARWRLWGGLALLVGGTLVWTIGRRLNRSPSQALGDLNQMSGFENTTTQAPLAGLPRTPSVRRHTMFFIPLESWGFGYAFLGTVLVGLHFVT